MILFIGIAIIILIAGINSQNKSESKGALTSVVQRFSSIDYQGGHPELPLPKTINIEVDTTLKLFNLLFVDGSKLKRIPVKSEDIIDISLEEKSSRSVGKTATGAIVGGLLTGGIGLIAGAAIGASKKNQSMLYISFKYLEHDLTIILKTGKKTNELYSALIGLLKIT